MKRISSRWTFFYKRVLPLIWFAALAFVMLAILVPSGRRFAPPAPLVAMPLVLGIFGYLILRRLVLDLADQVWDDGDALLISNAGIEQRIALADIINIGFSTMTRPERVTLLLRDPGLMRKEIVFSPRSRFLPWTRSPIIDDLIERVDRARTQPVK
jgi:hypothetical protein